MIGHIVVTIYVMQIAGKGNDHFPHEKNPLNWPAQQGWTLATTTTTIVSRQRECVSQLGQTQFYPLISSIIKIGYPLLLSCLYHYFVGGSSGDPAIRNRGAETIPFWFWFWSFEEKKGLLDCDDIYPKYICSLILGNVIMTRLILNFWW